MLLLDAHYLGKQKVGVKLNGVDLESFTSNGKRYTEVIRFDPSLLKGDEPNVLEFDLPDARKPSNGDPRELAIGLHTLKMA